ncbi:MAG: hypothetical protein ACTSQE_08260 [Candidatus Heimdallarchaeaceae archaeon]
MDPLEIYRLIVTNNGGIPKITVNMQEGLDDQMDPVLFSGFIVAIVQFLSEVLSSKENHTRFAQEKYEGIIAIVNDNYYSVAGRNLFQYPFEFYMEIFTFIEQYFFIDQRFNTPEEREYLVKALLSSIIYMYHNVELIVPELTDKEPYFWSKESEAVYKLINGVDNIKELTLAPDLKLEQVFAIVMIFIWLDVVTFKLEVRDYTIFEKSSEVLKKAINSDFESFATIMDKKTYNVFKAINGRINVAEIKRQFPDLDIKNILNTLIENNLICTINEDNAISLLISDYFNFILSDLAEALPYKEVQRICEKAIEDSNSMFYFPVEKEISHSLIMKLLKDLSAEGYTIQKTISRLLRPVKNIYLLLKKKHPKVPEKLFGKVYTKMIEKHGFHLERMNLLEIFCPEEYLL